MMTTKRVPLTSSDRRFLQEKIEQRFLKQFQEIASGFMAGYEREMGLARRNSKKEHAAVKKVWLAFCGEQFDAAAKVQP